jgi:hypothetical protein
MNKIKVNKIKGVRPLFFKRHEADLKRLGVEKVNKIKGVRPL